MAALTNWQPGNLLEMQILRPSPRPTELATWGGSSKLHFNKSSRWLPCKLKVENHSHEVLLVIPGRASPEKDDTWSEVRAGLLNINFLLVGSGEVPLGSLSGTVCESALWMLKGPVDTGGSDACYSSPTKKETLWMFQRGHTESKNLPPRLKFLSP